MPLFLAFTFQLERVKQGKFAYFENEYFLRELSQMHDDKITNVQNNAQKPLHVMRECTINMPISIGLEKNSPLKPEVDKLLRRMIEAGLVSKWLSDSIKPADDDDDIDAQDALITLKKMYGAVVALGVGHLTGLLVLISEILYYRYWVLRRIHKRNQKNLAAFLIIPPSI